ncbi:restriction endonuclease [Halomonas sp. LR3S48]|uniref:restriction endonuclease n=1 Tax=Halomonas sp. LR3S48 TaxID=2982694 RepID=UPI0021E3D875|nr:restriction endonuclease [Halomonas sp. LR3S48]UYG05542.1 restriction endonuclease [Halomonas sp. LR3S48]
MTIVEAIKKVMQDVGKPLTYKEIYQEIIYKNLYRFGAKDPEALVNSKLRKHCLGLDFPSASPAKHFVIVGKRGKGAKYFLVGSSHVKTGAVQGMARSSSEERLPEEKLHDAYLEHRSTVKNLLLEQILSSDPAFFERLVVDLLLAMGYGGSVPNAGLVSGGAGDGGIDGIIKEDELGLGKIYIQAKRYAVKPVGRPDLQRFVGAMENVHKGVFITTSTFCKTAELYVDNNQKSIVLVDGHKLCELMITHRVGVSVLKEYLTFKVDSDYFVDD